MGEEIKHVGTDLSGLNRVKIFNAKGELIRIVHAKRLEPNVNQFYQTKRANKKNLVKVKEEKKLKASDLIEI